MYNLYIMSFTVPTVIIEEICDFFFFAFLISAFLCVDYESEIGSWGSHLVFEL